MRNLVVFGGTLTAQCLFGYAWYHEKGLGKVWCDAVFGQTSIEKTDRMICGITSSVAMNAVTNTMLLKLLEYAFRQYGRSLTVSTLAGSTIPVIWLSREITHRIFYGTNKKALMIEFGAEVIGGIIASTIFFYTDVV
ncbi:hypothetical protein SNEBB_009546 [Seison nebaliae]|nr:hypothetical protein SNEBB_009546 [Seison nebaliae]